MTASSRTPTASGISRLLAGAGFKRSVSGKGRGGRLNWTAGFEVRKDWATEGAVRVSHNFWSMGGGGPEPHLDRYAEAIRAAGWNAEIGVRGDLIVTARTGEE